MLRRRQVEVVHADRVEEVDVGYVEEGQVQNVDVEVVEEDREDDPDQVMLMTTAKTMKLAKSMSTLEVGAKDDRLGQRDLVEEDDVEEVVQEMLMSRCGGVVMSLLTMGRGVPGIGALLPCQIPGPLKGVPRWGCSEVVGLSSHLSMHGRWLPWSCRS